LKTYTTKAAEKLVRKELGERARQLGLVRAENESGTICVEMHSDEADDFERVGHGEIDSDVIADDLMDTVVAYLADQKLA
jgi:hypothetical protein